MKEYDLIFQFLNILALFGVICSAILYFWWKSYSRPVMAPDRRQINLKVEVERRKGEDRRKQPRYAVA